MKKIFIYVFRQVIIPNLLWIVIINIPVAYFSLYSIVTSLMLATKSELIPNNYIIWAVIGSIICTVCIICNIIYLLHYFINKKKKPRFPIIETGYKNTSSEIELYFEDKQNIIQSQIVNFKVFAGKIEKFDYNLTWTGLTYIKSEIDTDCPGYQLIDSYRKHSPFQIEIICPETKKRGESGHYSFHTNVQDGVFEDGHLVKCCMEPHLSKTVKCQTDRLTLKLTVPRNFIDNVSRCIFADSSAQIPLCDKESVVPKRVGDLDYYEWNVTEPELLHTYRIDWRFKEANE